MALRRPSLRSGSSDAKTLPLLLPAPLAVVVFLAVFLGPRLFDEDPPGENEYQRLAEEADDPGRVEIWGAWEGNEQESFEAVLDGYMAAFPGTDVVYVPLGDELEERIRRAAAEKSLPDLANLSGTRLPQELAGQACSFRSTGSSRRPPTRRIWPAAAARLGTEPPEAAQLFAGEEAEAGAAAPFPAIGEAGPAANVTGEQAVMLRYSRVSEDLMSYLVTDEAIDTFTSFGLPTLARDVDPSIWDDETTQVAVADLRDAVDYRYDLSDLLPEELASVEGEGLLSLFRDVLRDPDDVEEIAEHMEAVAKQVYRD